MDVEDFKDIMIVKVDRDRTQPHSHPNYNVMFELSATPPKEWNRLFEEIWKRSQLAREAFISGEQLLLRCPLEEAEQHVDSLKKAVETTNHKFREYLKELATKQEQQKKANKEWFARKTKMIDQINKKIETK